MILGLAVWCALAATPEIGASVLLARAVPPDAVVLRQAVQELAGEAPREVAPGVLEAARLGRVTLTSGEALADMEAARARGLSKILTDEPLPAHVASWHLALAPAAGLSKVAALDAVTRLAAALARSTDAVGVYFEAGRVMHPARWVLGALREKTPAAWLWVGFELGGDKERLTLTSLGLGQAGLAELELGAARADIGAAIETFFELVARALARGSDFPDGAELAREGKSPLVVRRAAGEARWRVEFRAR